jgi:hypothetical protein
MVAEKGSLLVGAEPIDPLNRLGIVSDQQLPFWGWGTMPDQYGRRRADDGMSEVPKRPKTVLADLLSILPPGGGPQAS